MNIRPYFTQNFKTTRTLFYRKYFLRIVNGIKVLIKQCIFSVKKIVVRHVLLLAKVLQALLENTITRPFKNFGQKSTPRRIRIGQSL